MESAENCHTVKLEVIFRGARRSLYGRYQPVHRYVACFLSFWNKLSQTDNLPLQFTYHLTLTASVYLSVKPVKYKNDTKNNFDIQLWPIVFGNQIAWNFARNYVRKSNLIFKSINFTAKPAIHCSALSYWIISNLSKEWLDHKTVGQSTVLKIVGVLSFLVDPFFSNWVEKYTTHLCVGHQRLFTFYNGQILAPELKNAFKKHFYVLPPIGLGK